MAIQQPRWMLLAALASLAATVPRPARAQAAPPEWTTPVYRPPATSVTPPPASPPAPPVSPPPGYPEPLPPGYAPGYGPPAYVPPAAPPPPAAPGAPTHQGFFLRLHLGGGSSSYSGSGGTAGSTQISGGNVSFGIALGTAVGPNVALFGNYFVSVASQPSVSGNATAFSSVGDAGVDGFGGGVVYYFEPVNLYLSAAIAATFLLIDDPQGKALEETNTGIGFEAMVGKEWWVSQHWGIGGAAEFVGATDMKGHDVPGVTWSGRSFNLAFSATYY